MTTHPDIEALESGIADALQHAAGCAECARELAWLKAERALMARRPQPKTDHLWAGIEKQIARRAHRPHWAWRASVAAAGLAASAAMLLVVLKPKPAPVVQEPIAWRHEYKPDPKALAARWDETLTRARANLGEARSAVAAQDINARMQVLDGYAGYLRSLRNVIEQSEEANP